MYKYKIGIIVTWFGKFPSYFPAWLASAKKNPDIDFLLFCDQEFESCASNINVYHITLNESIKSFEKKMGRKIKIKDGYKFCDCRAFFGILYENYLKKYDFWGYCDIDLVFGNIRNFLTDELLEKYDRFYSYGHLSVFRNTEYVNHLYRLPGSIYSMYEIFEGKAKTTFEEYYGLNRICQKNHIAWYVKTDFADFATAYPNRMELNHKLKNYKNQIFVWHDGRAYRIYKDSEGLKEEDFLYMHWQKKQPKIEGNITDQSYLVLTGTKIIVTEHKEHFEYPRFDEWNPELSDQERNFYRKKSRKEKYKKFLRADFATKRIWIRQQLFEKLDKRNRIYS